MLFRSVDKATILNVECDVVTRAGKTARGFGSMPLSNIWGFPSKVMNYDQTLGAMTALAEQWVATRDGQDLSARFDWVAHRVD